MTADYYLFITSTPNVISIVSYFLPIKFFWFMNDDEQNTLGLCLDFHKC